MAQTQIVLLPVGELREMLAEIITNALAHARPNEQPDEVLDRGDAAKLLKISLPTLRQLEMKGWINAIRYPDNRRVYYLRRELLASLTVVGQQKRPRQ